MKNPTPWITKEDIADAQLVAAAGDLLKALNALLYEVDASGNGTAPDYGWPSAVSASRAAIAKARGDRS